jgi:Permuted papain-like amidase enzyme, YaeF/YiiX, C92 family
LASSTTRACSEGVVFTSLEHSIGEADSVALLRPRLDPAQTREAIARAFSHAGKPYDFEFDFFSSDKLVCTELVYRAYDGPIRFPLKNIMGTTTLPAIEFVRKFAAERGTPAAQFEFICCLEGNGDTECASFVDEARFLETLNLPGSDLFIGN